MKDKKLSAAELVKSYSGFFEWRQEIIEALCHGNVSAWHGCPKGLASFIVETANAIIEETQ